MLFKRSNQLFSLSIIRDMLLQESPKSLYILLYFIIVTFATQQVLSKTSVKHIEVPNRFGILDLNEDDHCHLKKNHLGR